ncbi:ROK family transcriptional regulator [Serinicoccus hydrothermalis]|uniref:ROK family transcriptional regulator n=1 Tax=Serinicoccus hydrothermalis TaxID=1758689 RepID=UPI00083697CE|nr:ROK family protein [Serinicoccus hydrothermalis]
MDQRRVVSGGRGPRHRGNAAAVLRVVSDRDEVTRQEIARHTGLSRSTVADLVTRLLESGDLTEATQQPGGRGRPAQLVRRADPQGLLLGLDLGHNHVTVALGDASAAVLQEVTVDADLDRDPDATIDLTRDLALEVLAREGSSLSDVAAAVAGLPGPMSHAGVLSVPSMLGQGQMRDPGRRLSRVLGMPVPVTTDTVLGAVGELRSGAAMGVDDVIFVKASHGVGCALVLGGQIYRGSGGLAGEFGHTRVGDGAIRCRCGNLGCLETVAGLERVLAELPHPYTEAALTAEGVGDPVVSRVVTDAGRAVGSTLAPICNALNPALVVTGGGLGAVHAEAFGKGVREAIDRDAQPAIASALQVVPAQHGVRAERIGALLLARREAMR